MKIKLAVSDENYDKIERALTESGFEIDDSAPFVLLETDKFASHISVRDESSNRVHILTDDIVYIESYGHTVDVHLADETYRTTERLYQLSYLLDPTKFIRISNSVIIQRSKVKKIIPSLSMKFNLIMSNGDRVDVTRTYYNIFKEFFGI